MIKLTNMIAIGIFIISAIAFLKMKPMYQISMDGEVIGYVKNKTEFEEIVYHRFNDNEEENIAFADWKADIFYQRKMIPRTTKSNESEILVALEEKADITYFQYAICVNGEEKQTCHSYEVATKVIEQVKKEIGEEVQLSIARTYSKEKKEESPIEIASLCKELNNSIQKEIAEEKRRQKATINGVYMAVVPVKGNITSRYGAREAIRDHTHKGLDIAAKTGTPIKASADGTVVYAGTMGGYGKLIMIDHGNDIKTYYGHCSKLYKKVGDTVSAGDVIAAVGNTGNSTGPHLHFEIRKKGVYVNPANYLF